MSITFEKLCELSVVGKNEKPYWRSPIPFGFFGRLESQNTAHVQLDTEGVARR